MLHHMGITINEVQIICVTLMGLMSLLIGFLLPHFLILERVYNQARKILTAGLVLICIHYGIQYILHKSGSPAVDTRSIINLTFGFPVSYCFIMTQFYLQRHGNVKLWVWIYPVVLYAAAMIIISTSLYMDNPPLSVSAATVTMSILYAIQLISGSALHFREYYRIKEFIRINGYSPLETLNRWTKWSIFLIGIVSVGLPIMTFNSNLAMRSAYGIYSISAAFFYLFCFIGYGLSKGPNEVEEFDSSAPDFDEKAYESYFFNRKALDLNEKDLGYVNQSISKWVEQKNFLKPGLTVKSVAEELNIQRSQLSAWLLSSKYKQFNLWINFMRINEAKSIIQKHPNWSNETVAMACGFTNRSYFQRQFREITGTTPSKWEAKQRLSEPTSKLK